MTFLHFILVVGAVLSCWSVLRCLANERQRRVTELELRLSVERQAQEPASPSPQVRAAPSPERPKKAA